MIAAVEAAQAEIVRLDELLSIGNESSEVSRINQNSGGMPGDDVAALADYALMLNRLTDGAYDMTILPIMELWGFTTGEYAVPGEDELAKALALCGSDLVTYNEVSYNQRRQHRQHTGPKQPAGFPAPWRRSRP